MKYVEMNTRQKKAFRNVYHATNWHLGGLENVLQDYPEDSEEYKNAKAQLEDHEGLVNAIYDMATTEIYDEGCCIFNDAAKSYLKDIRFCGKEWLLERIEARLRREGY